jgi:hypothetical protein
MDCFDQFGRTDQNNPQTISPATAGRAAIGSSPDTSGLVRRDR